MAKNDYIIKLPTLREPTSKTPENARNIIKTWTQAFEKVLANNVKDGLSTVFREDAWIRDFLALSWDFRTINDLDEITTFFKENQPRAGIRRIVPREKGAFQPSFGDPAPGVHWVESMFDFESSVGRGKGMVRLALEADDTWKAFMINFTLLELKGFEEKVGVSRPTGHVDPKGGNWKERRERQVEFVDEDPAVLVIGAGHAGLNIGVRLRNLGLPTLLIDRNEHVGDSWRKRYRTLMTHDPIQYCHLPFIPFPGNWPQFMPKDKLADWLESYAKMMELNIWTSTTIEETSYNEKEKTWTVKLRRADGTIRTLKPRHIVLATGQAGDPITPTLPGQDDFKGVVYHGSQHQDASLVDNLSSKKVLVVGSGNSSHDICQNFYENGAAQVTMIQRGGTYVITANKGIFVMHKGMYEEGGPPTEDCDIVAQSIPIPVQFALSTHGTKAITAVDQELLDGLSKAGFKLDFGPEGSGIYRKYITRGGGYYIDVGCSQLIVDGKVKVHHSPGGITGFTPTGLKLADGTTLDADIVVLATGYDGMRSSTRNILGDKVADRVKECWDLDEQGEINSIWRSSGHPRFYYMGGNLALCRSYSRLLALQIKAVEENILV
ncbi:flavin-containing monooxygenase [Colletotrichum scovillei]|uniref:Flavin-containing monooxygenase n=1 Tax=Colletotrichum scovillei TaxID=1209932 RepID=A0A9P7QVL2_9PEZI|nr:flavin-containing monooxygenase [Colletotrichum scovillei]KAF4774902.1 flavin-containing monooxygenase [Colletotrichum scovillei]KAG7039690.1 flavin-containing monooxygenase [Colletotrichum scovillei]KAG7041868.1 flavin-containing monooxygenase [Colletotrichum scovillei]KAG7061898.1 flavin-containing monooxygenase [Colletotrichum scovillei]